VGTPENFRPPSLRAGTHVSAPRPAAASHAARVPRVTTDVRADVKPGPRDLTPAPAKADVGGPSPAAPPSTSPPSVEATATAPLETVDDVIQTTTDVGEALGLPPVTVPPVKIPPMPVQLPAAPTLPSLDLP